MPIDGLGHAFEHFFSSIFRGDLGQYFTHRELVRFAVAMVQPTDRDFVIDPSCGSGGFLLETLLQVGHYIDASYAGQPDVDRRKYDFAHDNLYGIEIHDILGRVCQTNLLLHKDGHTNIETERSCLDSDFANRRINPNGKNFTVVVGNPPFGGKVKEGDSDALGNNELESFELGMGYKQAKSEVLILERSLQFLEPGGRLAMVIPDGMLNNAGERSQCPPFRRYLLQTARIDAIVSLPDHAFRHSGAQNKTSILFATRFTKDEKRRFDREFNREMEELTRERQQDAGEDAELEVIEEDDEDAAPVSASALAKARLAAKATERVITNRFNYLIFMAEAEEIGYGPTGAKVTANDLYSTAGVSPNRDDLSTILGQYSRFKMGPENFEGTTTPQAMAIPVDRLFSAHSTYRMDPKFHLFERERFTQPPPGMALLRLGDALRRREERVDPTSEPDQEFLVPSLSQHGELTPREPGQGKNPPSWFGQYFTKGSRWFRMHTDDLVFSQIDLWKGCLSIVPEEFEGAILTQEFPIYEVDRNQIEPYYLKLVLRSRYFQRAIRAITTGHSNRRRTQSTDFEELTVFIPEDTAIQRRVSEAVWTRERTVATKLAEYRSLLAEIDRLVIGELEPADLLTRYGD